MDMHILQGRIISENPHATVTEYTIVCHVAVTNPKATVTFPDLKSQVPDISSTELGELQAGTKLERSISVRRNSNWSQAQFETECRKRHKQLKADTNEQYDKKYALYGQTLAES